MGPGAEDRAGIMTSWEPIARVAPVRLPDATYAALRDAYATPPRAYHNLDHILEVIGHWQDVDARIGWPHRAETFLALLYHDAIYVAGRTDNEALSAELALRQLASIDGLDRRAIERMISLTAKHGRLVRSDVGDEEALFVDCDMAILGAPVDRFDAYDRAIREEYSYLPDLVFRTGRRSFFERLLASPRIYLSDDFSERFEAQARRNLSRCLAR
jgi:predicted metal-dependent HD superfamily phosphohydrolase